MINVSTFFQLAELQSNVPGWARSEHYYNCESSGLRKLYRFFAKR